MSMTGYQQPSEMYRVGAEYLRLLWDCITKKISRETLCTELGELKSISCINKQVVHKHEQLFFRAAHSILKLAYNENPLRYVMQNNGREMCH